jgi:hypothetical protein
MPPCSSTVQPKADPNPLISAENLSELPEPALGSKTCSTLISRVWDKESMAVITEDPRCSIRHFAAVHESAG